MKRPLFCALLLVGCRDYERLRDHGRDAGRTDAAMVSDGAMASDGAVFDPCTNAILCEPFEGMLSSQWSPIVSSGKAVLTLDDKHVHGGMKAAHVFVEATSKVRILPVVTQSWSFVSQHFRTAT